MKSKSIVAYVGIAFVMFMVGFVVRDLEFETTDEEILSGAYEWVQDLIVVGQDREIVIDKQNGVFIAMEPYLDPIYFTIKDQHFYISQDTMLQFYPTEIGFNIIEEGGITHSVWQLKTSAH